MARRTAFSGIHSRYPQPVYPSTNWRHGRTRVGTALGLRDHGCAWWRLTLLEPPWRSTVAESEPATSLICMVQCEIILQCEPPQVGSESNPTPLRRPTPHLWERQFWIGRTFMPDCLPARFLYQDLRHSRPQSCRNRRTIMHEVAASHARRPRKEFLHV